MSFKAAHVLIAGAVITAGCCVSPAQEMVHALTGVATKVDTSAHTITLTDGDGSQAVIPDDAKNHPRYEFDKMLQADATDSANFDKQGDRVILYYFGDGWQRRAVAVKDLGQTQLKLASGQITHWDRHHHIITIKATDGTKQTFQLDNKTAVDTPMGVVNGEKFDPQNGDQILIKYQNKNGDNDAVFLSES
jgi:hypothetical protein